MILVVGGAGYVGSVLVRELLERGYAVKVFDRLYYGDQGIRTLRKGSNSCRRCSHHGLSVLEGWTQ
jgi:nucleoside-diphosphate-sugar epimerase